MRGRKGNESLKDSENTEENRRSIDHDLQKINRKHTRIMVEVSDLQEGVGWGPGRQHRNSSEWVDLGWVHMIPTTFPIPYLSTSERFNAMFA